MSAEDYASMEVFHRMTRTSATIISLHYSALLPSRQVAYEIHIREPLHNALTMTT
jgi:hypothetical protein